MSQLFNRVLSGGGGPLIGEVFILTYFYLQHVERMQLAIGTLSHSMLNMLNLFFTKEPDSSLETQDFPTGDDGFLLEFLIFLLKKYSVVTCRVVCCLHQSEHLVRVFI